jgi:hypothetical protein
MSGRRGPGRNNFSNKEKQQRAAKASQQFRARTKERKQWTLHLVRLLRQEVAPAHEAVAGAAAESLANVVQTQLLPTLDRLKQHLREEPQAMRRPSDKKVIEFDSPGSSSAAGEADGLPELEPDQPRPPDRGLAIADKDWD